MGPSLPFLFGYELLKKPMLTCAAIGNCVNAALGYFLTFHTTWGVHGAAVARSVANACLLWSLLVYLYVHQASCWSVPTFVALGTSGLLMMLFEWWSFELLVFFAGLESNAATAIGANAIQVNVTSCIYMVHFGVGTAAQIRVGNALGAGFIHNTRQTVQSAVVLGVSIGLAFAALLGMRFRYSSRKMQM
ncbi:hypothetical protein B5M09_002589 [Aphanomyces astaci]|uniref:Uncharacterized protein n=1 Tax=Aphanomyces astaci TaxID=112090 RepID=A0A3R7WLV2_APHAT|nr:hypothetical protein B5M09_002589 [Aphanomyces astaci]